LLLQKITEKEEECQAQKLKESTYNPKTSTLSAPLPNLHRRKKKTKVKSKITWKDAEVLIPSEYACHSTKRINSKKLYKNLMKEWQDEDAFNKIAQGSSKSINFNRSFKPDASSSKSSLPELQKQCKNPRRLRISTTNLKYSTMNSEKFIIEMQKKKDSEKLDKYRAQSLGRSGDKCGPVASNTLNVRKGTNVGLLRALPPRNRVKILTPICLNTSTSSALSVSMCSERES
jgi:hypothetical protein